MLKATGLVSGSGEVDKEARDDHQHRTRRVDPGGAAPDPAAAPSPQLPSAKGALASLPARALTLVCEPASNDSFKT